MTTSQITGTDALILKSISDAMTAVLSMSSYYNVQFNGQTIHINVVDTKNFGAVPK